MYNIEFYSNAKGESQIIDYITQLQNDYTKDGRVRAKKVAMYIDLLAKYGLTLKQPYIKKINEIIWELRPLDDRILFASMHNNKIVLLSVFRKKSKKTPKKEIEKAERFLNDYVKRSGIYG